MDHSHTSDCLRPGIGHPLLPALALALAVCAMSCVRQPQTAATQPVPEAPAPSAINVDALDTDTAYAKALNAYWIGDYKGAAAVFESLFNRVEDQADRSKFLFGLACARLAGAETPEEFRAARAIWVDWEKNALGANLQIDPRMLTAFLNNARFFAQPREPKVVKTPDMDCAKRLQDKEKEVMNLGKQIKALEAIHREIQEKKRMTTP